MKQKVAKKHYSRRSSLKGFSNDARTESKKSNNKLLELFNFRRNFLLLLPKFECSQRLIQSRNFCLDLDSPSHF